MSASAKSAGLGHQAYVFGCRVADRGSNLAGHPTAILLVAASMVLWVIAGDHESESGIALVLALLAILLTQMVLNQQRRSEAALHLKIDELIHASSDARDDIAGVERREVEELEEIRAT